MASLGGEGGKQEQNTSTGKGGEHVDRWDGIGLAGQLVARAVRVDLASNNLKVAVSHGSLLPHGRLCTRIALMALRSSILRCLRSSVSASYLVGPGERVKGEAARGALLHLIRLTAPSLVLLYGFIFFSLRQCLAKIEQANLSARSMRTLISFLL